MTILFQWNQKQQQLQMLIIMKIVWKMKFIFLKIQIKDATQVKSTFSKVYIGSYGDINAAIEAQNKLLEANLPVSPFYQENE
ncbi:MAG: hypothetical protein L6V95_03855 [Candidatus Melainabacteria bacterium]|nr:MAG: hypothetical protein L6V95_03855 [Candidatus Melainabacteria bacterium]